MKVEMTFDTMTKIFTITVDGEPVADVDSVHIYKKLQYPEPDWDDETGPDRYMLEVCSCTFDDVHKALSVKRLVASETGFAENKQAVLDGEVRKLLGLKDRAAK